MLNHSVSHFAQVAFIVLRLDIENFQSLWRRYAEAWLPHTPANSHLNNASALTDPGRANEKSSAFAAEKSITEQCIAIVLISRLQIHQQLYDCFRLFSW